MTISTSLMLVVAACFSATTDEVASKLAGELVESGTRRVGVVPKVLLRTAGDDKVAADLGPRAELIAQELAAALNDQATRGPHGGKFTVVSHRVMREAFAELAANSLGSMKALKQVGEVTRADSLLAILATDHGNSIDLNYEIIPVSGDTGASVRSQRSDIKNLTDFAYMGHSFEARRWVNDRMLPLGLKGDPNLLGSGDIPLAELKQDQPHPMISKSFPYGIGVAVSGREAYAASVKQDLYVALNENEKYSIQVWNTGPRPVYMALYIDGINTIGKALEGPGTTSEGRMWCIDPSSKHATIKGYLTIGKAGEAQQISEEFIVTRREDSMAGRQGFNDRIGLITAVIYDFVPVASNPTGEKSLPQIGTKAGKKEAIEIKDWGLGKRGVMLAAVTLRYATPNEINALRSTDDRATPQQVPPVVKRPDVPTGTLAQQAFVVDAGAQRRPVNSTPNGKGEEGPGAANLEPDESVPFPREIGLAKRSSSDR